MGYTSSAVKQRWNAKHYDSVRVNLPKGMRDVLKQTCAAQGVSMNSVLAGAAKAFIEEHTDNTNE